MNGPMTAFPEMRGAAFQAQALPSWFRNMMGGQWGSMTGNQWGPNNPSNMMMTRTANLPSGFRMNDGFSGGRRFTDGQVGDFSPFYRFGSWSSPSFNNSGEALRIQTTFPIRDRYGNAYNMGASLDNRGSYHFIKYSCGGDDFNTMSNNYQVIGSIPSRFSDHLGYFHAYGMTDNYLVFCEQPVAFNMSQLKNTGFTGDNLEYLQGEYNYFYIMDKRSGRTMEIKYVSDRPYFFYKFINCYEYENRVVIDVLGYDDSDFGPSMRSPAYFTERYASSKIMRFVLPLAGHQLMELGYSGDQWVNGSSQSGRFVVRPEYLFRESGLRHPFINPNYSFRKYQFAYGSSGNSLMKFDTEEKKAQVWRAESDFWRPFRSCFIANPTGRYEDDGVLIACFSDMRDRFTSQNYIVFIDARNMKEMSRFNFNGPFEGNPSFMGQPFFMHF